MDDHGPFRVCGAGRHLLGTGAKALRGIQFSGAAGMTTKFGALWLAELVHH